MSKCTAHLILGFKLNPETLSAEVLGVDIWSIAPWSERTVGSDCWLTELYRASAPSFHEAREAVIHWLEHMAKVVWPARYGWVLEMYENPNIMKGTPMALPPWSCPGCDTTSQRGAFCSECGYMRDEGPGSPADLDAKTTVSAPYPAPLMPFALPKETEAFTACGSCLCWGPPKTAAGHLGGCRKHAPSPTSRDATSPKSALQAHGNVVSWPQTLPTDGCFEGVPKTDEATP